MTAIAAPGIFATPRRRWWRLPSRARSGDVAVFATVDVAAVATTGNSVTTITKSVTSNATGNRAALVLALQRDSGGSTVLHTGTCTYAGTAMTLISSALVNGHCLYAFKLANPATGTQTVSCTLNGLTSQSLNLLVIVATGVDQTTIAHNFLTASGNSTTGSVAVTGLGASDIAAALYGSSTSGAGWTNATQDANSLNIGVDNTGANTDVAASRRAGANGATNMTYAVTTGQWAAVSAQLIDAGVAAAGPPRRPLISREALHRSTRW